MTAARSGGRPARAAWSAIPKRPGSIKRSLALLASLNELGWHRSAGTRASVDQAGDPLPWYTYPAILWLGPRLRPTDVVFEYGAGNSTRWYATRVAQVVSVEHDPSWADRVSAGAPANSTVLPRQCLGDGTSASRSDPYVAAIEDAEHELYDVVVVDGMARVTCVEAAIPKLAPSSLLIFDNADRPHYREGRERLSDAGFGRIDFMGPVPGSGRLSCTSVFGRDLERWVSPNPDLPWLGY